MLPVATFTVVQPQNQHLEMSIVRNDATPEEETPPYWQRGS